MILAAGGERANCGLALKPSCVMPMIVVSQPQTLTLGNLGQSEPTLECHSYTIESPLIGPG